MPVSVLTRVLVDRFWKIMLIDCPYKGVCWRAFSGAVFHAVFMSIECWMRPCNSWFVSCEMHIKFLPLSVVLCRTAPTKDPSREKRDTARLNMIQAFWFLILVLLLAISHGYLLTPQVRPAQRGGIACAAKRRTKLSRRPGEVEEEPQQPTQSLQSPLIITRTAADIAATSSGSNSGATST
jgi:hypothetical protein